MSYLQQAKIIIARAESDLGPLTNGQRRDLLADNMDLTLDTIVILVDAIRATVQS